jgi:hypothetical protein
VQQKGDLMGFNGTYWDLKDDLMGFITMKSP